MLISKVDLIYVIFSLMEIKYHSLDQRPKGNLFSNKFLQKEKVVNSPLYALIPYRNQKHDASVPLDPMISNIMEVFNEISLDDLSNSLPFLRDVQCNINLMLGSSLPIFLVTWTIWY